MCFVKTCWFQWMCWMSCAQCVLAFAFYLILLLLDDYCRVRIVLLRFGDARNGVGFVRFFSPLARSSSVTFGPGELRPPLLRYSKQRFPHENRTKLRSWCSVDIGLCGLGGTSMEFLCEAHCGGADGRPESRRFGWTSTSVTDLVCDIVQWSMQFLFFFGSWLQ